MKLIDADALEKAIYEWMPKDQETWADSDIPPISFEEMCDIGGCGCFVEEDEQTEVQTG